MKIDYKILDIENISVHKLEEAKNFLRITHDYDNKHIQSLIYSATEYAENFTGICIHNKHIVCYVKNASSVINLKYSPIIKIKSLSVKSKEGNFEEVSLDEVSFDNEKIYFNSNIKKDIKIEYIAGIRQDSIKNLPYNIQHGILLHSAYMYDFSDEGSHELINNIQAMYLPYRLNKI